MENVIAVVVQPGVEEKDSGCTEYDREKAKELMASIADFQSLYLKVTQLTTRQKSNCVSL